MITAKIEKEINTMSRAACAKLLICSTKTAAAAETVKDRLRTVGDITQSAADPVIAILEDCMAKIESAREMIPLNE
jgi:hypothetical protein